MNGDGTTTPASWAALGAEGAILLSGIVLLLWLLLSAKGRLFLESRLAPWDISPPDVLLFFGCGITGAYTLVLASGMVLRHVHWAAGTIIVAQSALMEAGFLVGLVVFAVLHPRPSAERESRMSARAAMVGGAATFLVSMPFVMGVSFGWEHFLRGMGFPDEQQELVGVLEEGHSTAFRLVFIVIAAVLVPIAEESLFRGGLFRYLRTRIPGWAANAVTSILFASLHVQWSEHMQGLPSLLPLIVLASFFCVAYERTGSLVTPIVAHALFNLNMVLLVIAGVG